jgi:predicted nucleic acid-binding protein
LIHTFLDAGVLIAALRGEEDVAALVIQAYTAACLFGLSALDTLHITVAKTSGVEEFITTEKPTQPLFRVPGIVIGPSSRLEFLLCWLGSIALLYDGRGDSACSPCH